MGDKKKSLIIGSLIGSIGFIIEFTKKLPSLITLMSSTVFNDSLGWKAILIRLMNEV